MEVAAHGADALGVLPRHLDDLAAHGHGVVDVLVEVQLQLALDLVGHGAHALGAHEHGGAAHDGRGEGGADDSGAEESLEQESHGFGP